MSSCHIKIKEESFELLPERAIYWQKKETLIISDLHLGKAGHFRKHGIPISRKIHLTDLNILERLLHETKPSRVLLLGDLFHSSENIEWQDFIQLLEAYPKVEFTLIQGNHDILEEYPETLKVIPKLVIEPFSFTHYKELDDYFNLSGHIHPGIRIRGNARQGMTLPCFYFSDQFGVLPAFGQFTGIKTIKPTKRDRVFGIADGKVIELI